MVTPSMQPVMNFQTKILSRNTSNLVCWTFFC